MRLVLELKKNQGKKKEK